MKKLRLARVRRQTDNARFGYPPSERTSERLDAANVRIKKMPDDPRRRPSEEGEG